MATIYRSILCAVFLFVTIYGMSQVGDLISDTHQIMLHHITFDAVKQHQNVIDAVMYRHRCVKAVIVSGVTAVSCVYAFGWLKEHFKEHDPIATQMPMTIYENVQLTESSYMAWFNDIATSIKNTFSFKVMQSVIGNFM